MVLSADLKSILLNEGYLERYSDPMPKADDLTMFKEQIKPGRVQAVTNRGIRLGFSEKQVREILGNPSKAIWSSRFQARELIYRWESKKTPDGVSTVASNYYLFRNGKLYYLELARSLLGGG